MQEVISKQFLYEMSIVAEAVYKAFDVEKLNYELLGNGDSHLHWHLFPRRENDTRIKGPVWWVDREEMFAEKVMPSTIELEEMKVKLLRELEKLMLKNEKLKSR